MKALGLISTLLFSLTVQAQSPAELIQSLEGLSPLMQTVTVTKYCANSLRNWPSSSYNSDMIQLGRLWSTKPELAYLVLDTCQTLWTERYFNPLKYQISDVQCENAHNALLAPILNVLNSASYLREEIYAFSSLRRLNDGRIPPAPYEILMGMASSQRQLDEALHREMEAAVRILAGAGGGLAAVLLTTKDIATVTRIGSAAAGRVFKQALIATVLAWGAEEVASYGVWKVRYADLKSQVKAIKTKMKEGQVPTPVLVDEYYVAVKRLGYFLSYDLYLKESNQAEETPSKPRSCTTALDAYYKERVINPSAKSKDYVNYKTCKDASVLWLEAADYLRRSYPGQESVQLVAAKLSEEAMAVYTGYQAAWAYIASLPVCRQVPSKYIIFKVEYECFDPKSGAPMI
jgi:hypothetical protein